MRVCTRINLKIKRSENLERMIKPQLSLRTDALCHAKRSCYESRGASRKHIVLRVRTRIVAAIATQEVFPVQSRSDSVAYDFGGGGILEILVYSRLRVAHNRDENNYPFVVRRVNCNAPSSIDP